LHPVFLQLLEERKRELKRGKGVDKEKQENILKSRKDTNLGRNNKERKRKNNYSIEELGIKERKSNSVC